MKPRLYVCAALLGAILLLTVYSDRKMAQFITDTQDCLTQAENALQRSDSAAAEPPLAQAVQLCQTTRDCMTHVLRTEHLTDLESTLEAVRGYLALDAPQEALGELRRAAVQLRSLQRLCHRLF